MNILSKNCKTLTLDSQPFLFTFFFVNCISELIILWSYQLFQFFHVFFIYRQFVHLINLSLYMQLNLMNYSHIELTLDEAIVIRYFCPEFDCVFDFS